MRSTVNRLPLAALLVGSLAAAIAAGPPVAGAATPPLMGTVSCTLTAASTFTPALGYRQGIGGKKVSPRANAKWRVEGTLTACSGAQTGGNPRRPGPIARGEILLKGKADGHQCASLTANGLTVSSVRIKWFDATGNRMPTTKATGSTTVAGLYGGFPPFISLDPITLDPSYVPPGVITFHGAGTVKGTARAFPGGHVTLTAVADRALDSMVTPCNTHQVPSLTFGIDGFTFGGVHGPSSLSIS